MVFIATKHENETEYQKIIWETFTAKCSALSDNYCVIALFTVLIFYFGTETVKLVAKLHAHRMLMFFKFLLYEKYLI